MSKGSKDNTGEFMQHKAGESLVKKATLENIIENMKKISITADAKRGRGDQAELIKASEALSQLRVISKKILGPLSKALFFLPPPFFSSFIIFFLDASFF